MTSIRRAHGIKQNGVAGPSGRQLRKIEQTGAVSASLPKYSIEWHSLRSRQPFSNALTEAVYLCTDNRYTVFRYAGHPDGRFPS